MGIKVLKNRLSEYVKLAAGGETVLVTDRDRIVAELVPPRADRSQALAGLAAGVVLAHAGCATTAPEEPAPPRPAAPTTPAAAKPAAPDPRARTEEARALVAQAETDIQRARARRALWSKAWEALVGARASLEADDAAGAIRQARRASELAQLRLEQLAYPAVKLASRSSP